MFGVAWGCRGRLAPPRGAVAVDGRCDLTPANPFAPPRAGARGEGAVKHGRVEISGARFFVPQNDSQDVVGLRWGRLVRACGCGVGWRLLAMTGWEVDEALVVDGGAL